jgi:hypothetical protein
MSSLLSYFMLENCDSNDSRAQMSEINIDWTKFSRGPLSDDMWKAFHTLIYESHIYVKYQAEAREARRMALVPDPSFRQNANRARREWEKSARLHDETWHSAEFSAHEALKRMHKIGSDGGEDSPDWRFSNAVINAVGPLRHQTRCDFSVTALHGMDAALFLEIPSNQITEQLRSLRLLNPSRRG